MQATYNAIAGNAPLLVFALGAFVIGSALLAGAFGFVASRLYARANRLTWGEPWRAPGNAADNARAARINRLFSTADAIERANPATIVAGVYWRVRVARARRKARRRLDRLR